MHAPRSILSGAFALLCLLVLAVPARAACQVTPRRVVPLDLVGDLMLVPVEVNGVVSPFVLDTGAERTVVSNPAALALKIARDEWVSTDILGLGGRDRQRLGRPATISLAGVALRRRTMAADNSVVVGPIPTEIGGRPISGLLGQDFLSLFDLDLDPAHGRLTLYEVAGCVGSFLPWREPYFGIQAIRLVRNVLALPVKVNGQELTAELDSGSQNTLILGTGLQHMSLAAGGRDTLRGFGPGSAIQRLQRFDTVQIGAETITGMTLMLTSARSLRSIDLLLGADWLSRRHVWVSWSTDQVLVESGAARP